MGNSCCTNTFNHDNNEIIRDNPNLKPNEAASIIQRNWRKKNERGGSSCKSSKFSIKNLGLTSGLKRSFNDESSYTLVNKFPELDPNMERLIDMQTRIKLESSKEAYLKQCEGELIGPIKYSNGVYYYGEMRDGRKCGFSKIITEDSSCYYEGMVKDSLPDGFGIFILKSGEYYFGDWKEGRASGTGKFLSAEGVSKNYSSLRFHTKGTGSLIDNMVRV